MTILWKLSKGQKFIPIGEFTEIKKSIYKHASEPYLANGWKFEIYFEDGKIIASEPLTKNSWTEDPSKVGSYEYFNIGDFDGVRFVYDNKGNVTEFVELSDGEYDDELYDEVKRKYGNVEFYYSDEKPVIMKETDYLDAMVEESEFLDLDEIVDKIEERLS